MSEGGWNSIQNLGGSKSRRELRAFGHAEKCSIPETRQPGRNAKPAGLQRRVIRVSIGVVSDSTRWRHLALPAVEPQVPDGAGAQDQD